MDVTFNWIEGGLNNGHRQLRLKVNDDYAAHVYNAFDNGLWTARLNLFGKRGFESEAAATAHVEALIRRDIERRLAEADRAISLYRKAS